MMRFMFGRVPLQVLGLIVAAAVAASGQAGAIAQAVQINGAGATFPYPIYSRWFAEYAKVRPDVQIHYLSIGSGAGIQQLTDQMVFFGATDTPMTEEEIQEAPGLILHLPTVVGAVVPIYHVPEIEGELKLDGNLLADIFLGKVRNWNDPAIARLNGGLTLPATEITVVYRSDSSGTSFIWADFLAKISPEWRRLVGANRTLTLPVGVGARGNEAVSSLVKQTPGAMGYVELAYAVRNKNDIGLVRNADGEFVRPSVAAMTAAASAAVKRMPRDFRVSITNAPGKGAYPISSFTWILLYEKPGDRKRGRIMVEFMKWALTEGQALAADLGYAPLPPDIVKLEMTALTSIKVS
jgi:phosphate transport system substrate-binding protein